MAVKLLLIQALSSLHAGTGQGVGAIDLPIARERATELPLVPGSTIKGCIRDNYGEQPDTATIFGAEERQGQVQIGDARLLLLPVRCLGATFMWTTSPYVLRRLKRDAEAAKCDEALDEIAELAEGKSVVASPESLIDLGGSKRLVLEDFDFDTTIDATNAWAKWIADRLYPAKEDEVWRKEFLKRFAIIDDRSFQFLVRHATEVQAHVKIDHELGTVDKKEGGLWYQESLPAETVLVSILRVDERRGNAKQAWSAVNKGAHLQVGGKATTGHGLVRVVLVGGQA